MKKLMVLVFALLTMFALTACDKVPDDALVAECTQGESFKYVYKDDQVYEFYANGELQSQDMLDIVQTAVDNAGTVQDYLDATFTVGGCTISAFKIERSEKSN